MSENDVTKAKAMADDAGVDAAKYLSELIRPVVEREWVKFQRRIMGQEGGPEK